MNEAREEIATPLSAARNDVKRKEDLKEKEVGVGKKKRGEQPGNVNALKHGFYPKHYQRAGLQDLEEARDLQEEIALMRVVTRRLLRMARGCKEMGELINVLGALDRASDRVCSSD